jgi:hypothetical protein
LLSEVFFLIFLKSSFREFPLQEMDQWPGFLRTQEWKAEVWLMESLLPESEDEKKSDLPVILVLGI